MTYSDRMRNKHDRHIYDSPEEREERFARLSEKREFLEQKALYEYERRKDEGE